MRDACARAGSLRLGALEIEARGLRRAVTRECHHALLRQLRIAQFCYAAMAASRHVR